jgi:hypothetical protein
LGWGRCSRSGRTRTLPRGFPPPGHIAGARPGVFRHFLKHPQLAPVGEGCDVAFILRKRSQGTTFASESRCARLPVIGLFAYHMYALKGYKFRLSRQAAQLSYSSQTSVAHLPHPVIAYSLGAALNLVAYHVISCHLTFKTETGRKRRKVFGQPHQPSRFLSRGS